MSISIAQYAAERPTIPSSMEVIANGSEQILTWETPHGNDYQLLIGGKAAGTVDLEFMVGHPDNDTWVSYSNLPAGNGQYPFVTTTQLRLTLDSSVTSGAVVQILPHEPS